MIELPWPKLTRRRGALAGSRRRRRVARGHAPKMDTLEGRWSASTWSGATDGLWSSAGNWDTPPVAGVDLVFSATGANKTNTNDLAAGRAYGALTIAGSGYAIGGNAVALSGPVTASYTT